MLIPSQLTLIKRCQQQGGKSYQLSEITNDSAREETSCWMSASVGVGPGMTGNLGPWSRHPAWGHTTTTTMATIRSTLTVPKVSARYCTHCAHHLPVPLFPPRLPNPLWLPLMTTKPPTITFLAVSIPAVSIILVMLGPLSIFVMLPNVLISPNQTWPACCSKGAPLNTLTVPIVRARWYTCTGNIPAGSADRGHVSASRLNRRD